MNQPVAIILAGQPLDKDLNVIFGERETASLMIAGTMLLEHVLAELQDLNFKQCIVLANRNANEFQALANTSTHPSMKVEVLNYTVSKDQVLREFESLSDPAGLLIIEADKLRSHCVELFLAKCNAADYLLCEAVSALSDVGLTYLKPSKVDFIINAKPIEMPEVVMSKLTGARDFHRANIDLILGKYPGLEPSVYSHLVGTQMRHWSAKIDKRNKIDNTGIMIDHKCRIERNVTMKAVILNHNVYVERNACLHNTVVMPNTVIPANQNVSNAIIQGRTVYALSEA